MQAALNTTKALADGNRMRVVAALFRHDELCVCQIVEMLGLATATVSRHMKILQHAHLVKSRKDGRWVYYRLAEAIPQALRIWLGESLSNAPEIEADRLRLKTALACYPEELCRHQKERKDS